MNVNLLEIVSAARLRLLSLTAETAGYLVLAMLEAGGAQRRPRAEDVVLLESGEVRVAASGPPDDPALVESEVRELLGRLLMLCTVSHPALREVAVRSRSGALSRELESALIPVNRAAARRALARTCRETERARRTGKLDDVTAAREHLALSTLPPVQLPPQAAVQPAAVQPAAVQPAAVQPAAVQPAVEETLESLVEHTVRIDQLRPLPVTELAPVDMDVPAVRFAEVQLAADVLSHTPVLGSVATAVREQGTEAAAPEPQEFSSAVPEPEQVIEEPAVEDASGTDPGYPLQHTPAWQPSVRAVHRAVEKMAPPRGARAQLLEDGAGEAEGFSLLIDEADGAAEAEVVPAPSIPNEPTAKPSMVTGSAQARAVVYAPRQSDLGQLLEGFTEARVDDHDVSSELKQLAGIEASPTSQTPPPVGFSEVDAASPTPAGTTTSSKRDVLGRGAGVGLATLASLCTVWLVLRAAPQAQPMAPELAARPQVCRASIRVQDAPANAEIRLRAPAPAALSAPLSAHGSEALFPDLPCNSELEVMIRDLAQPDGPWQLIPVPAEDLDALTEHRPLQISAVAPLQLEEQYSFSER